MQRGPRHLQEVRRKYGKRREVSSSCRGWYMLLHAALVDLNC
jgi:hypothetical protein